MSGVAPGRARDAILARRGAREEALRTTSGSVAVLVIAMVVTTFGCDRLKGRGSADDSGAASVATAGSESAAPATGAKPGAAAEENLLSVASGAMILDLKSPDESDLNHAYGLLDDDPGSNWYTHPTGTYVLVLALPRRTQLKKLLWQGDAKKVVVEVSDDPSGKGAFQKIAEGAVSSGDAPKPLAVTKEVPARSVRFTVEMDQEHSHNHDVKGYGTKLDDPPWTKNATGVFSPTENELSLKQEGSIVTGCFGTEQISAVVDGPIVKGTLLGNDGKTIYPALLNLSPDGSRAVLFTFHEGTMSTFGGPRKSATPGSCAQWTEKKPGAAPVDPIAADIEKFGRARVYGIRFDTDSDVIKPESKAVLDRVVAVLKAKPDWKLTIEGHTDDTATPQHNQGLSERRAKAVEKWLEERGIAGTRLTPVGLGQTKPIAPNKTSIGRAENRRVELVKQ